MWFTYPRSQSYAPGGLGFIPLSFLWPPALGVQGNVDIATRETGCPSAITSASSQPLSWKGSEDSVQRRQTRRPNRTPWGSGKGSCLILYVK